MWFVPGKTSIVKIKLSKLLKTDWDHRAADLEHAVSQNQNVILSHCCPAGQLTLFYLLNVFFVLCRFYIVNKAVDLFFLISKKCYTLILMHSNVTHIKCRKRKFGWQFLILSIALPLNLANVKNILRNVNYRKTPISQNAKAMWDSRLSQQFTRKSF